MRLSELIWFGVQCRAGRLDTPRRQFALLADAGLAAPGEASLKEVAARLKRGGAEGPEVVESLVLAVLECCGVRFYERYGVLHRTNSTAALLSTVEAYQAYGPDLMRAALSDARGQVDLPGRERTRRRARVTRPLRLVGAPVALPYLSAREMVRDARGARRPGRRTRAEWQDAFIKVYALFAPPAVAVGAWFGFAALGRPAGLGGVLGGAVLCILGYLLAYGAFWIVGLGLSMDGSRSATRPPVSRVLELFMLLVLGALMIGVVAVCLAPIAVLLHLA